MYYEFGSLYFVRDLENISCLLYFIFICFSGYEIMVLKNFFYL